MIGKEWLVNMEKVFQRELQHSGIKIFSFTLFHPHIKMVPSANVQTRKIAGKNAYVFRVPIDPCSQLLYHSSDIVCESGVHVLNAENLGARYYGKVRD